MDDDTGPLDVKFWGCVDLASIPSLTDPDVCLCSHNPKERTVEICWGGYPWELDLDLVKTPEDLLWDVLHLSQKTWRGMTPNRIAALIDLVAKVKGWAPGETSRHENEPPRCAQGVLRERAKITPKVRWKVLKRDGWRCRACGFAVQNGAMLHVDHIVAVSRGGTSDMSNLQTLCSACNLGKSDE